LPCASDQIDNRRKIACQSEFPRKKTLLGVDSGMARPVSADGFLEIGIDGINWMGDSVSAELDVTIKNFNMKSADKRKFTLFIFVAESISCGQMGEASGLVFQHFKEP